MAKKLAANGRAASKTRPAFKVENGVVEIPLDDLAAFFARPNHFLAEHRLNARIPWIDRLDDSESLAAKLGKPLRSKLALEHLSDTHKALAAELETEAGRAPDPEAALENIRKIKPEKTVEIKRGRKVLYSCVDIDGQPRNLADAYLDFLKIPEHCETLEIDVGGTAVGIPMSCRTVDLPTSESSGGSMNSNFAISSCFSARYRHCRLARQFLHHSPTE